MQNGHHHVRIVDAESRNAAIQSRKEEELEAARKIDNLLQGQLPDGESAMRGCGFCTLFRRRHSRVRSSEVAASHASASSSSRLFGTSKSAASSHAKLQTAVSAMQVRATDLADRAALSRAKAVQLAKAGRKAEALLELKRAKAIEKQLATANAAGRRVVHERGVARAVRALHRRTRRRRRVVVQPDPADSAAVPVTPDCRLNILPGKISMFCPGTKLASSTSNTRLPASAKLSIAILT